MASDRRWRVACLCFDHPHQALYLRHALRHPRVEVVGLCDARPAAMAEVIATHRIDAGRVFSDWRECLERTRPDLVILCPPTADHARWVECLAPGGVHILLGKPLAVSLAEADRIQAAMQAAGCRLAVNWPLAWLPCHRTAKRLVDDGAIGELVEVHYHDGNRGPDHLQARLADGTAPYAWFHETAGGGSLLDYLGYGALLATWLMGGRLPSAVTALDHRPVTAAVDHRSVTLARYDQGISTFSTSWSTHADPWEHQPLPPCGLTLVGRDGTIVSHDYARTITLRKRGDAVAAEIPVDRLPADDRDPLTHVIARLEDGRPFDATMDLPMCRDAQRIVDAARASIAGGRVVPLA